MNVAEMLNFLQENAAWALGFGLAMFALTRFATLLNPNIRDDIALWLMGAQTETNWSKGFTALFDGVFGKNHLSLRCFIRSAIASLIAVTLIWLIMGSVDLRVNGQMALGTVVLLGLAINVIADYVSLLETRILLGRMPKNGWLQVGVLILDLIISAAIIWLAIFLYLRSPLHEGEVESFAEILGVFSVFSVFFYSTFLTSVWTWAYIGSVWLMRFIAWARIAHWLDAENQPVKVLLLVLSLATGVIAFAGALIVSGPLARDDQGTSIADRALCTMFRGRVCLDVAKLTPHEQTRMSVLRNVLDECYGVDAEECVLVRLSSIGVGSTDAIQLFSFMCENQYHGYCNSLGFLYDMGIGVDPDPKEAALHYEKSCEGGDARGCTFLGYLHQQGIGEGASNPEEAIRFYALACDGGDMEGCGYLGYIHQHGIGLEADPEEAARLYGMGCEGGNARSCTSLGYLLEHGVGMEPDPEEVARLYEMGCVGGDARGCNNLGFLHQTGIGVEPDLLEAARLYEMSCEDGDALGCTNLGYLHEKGIGMEPDPAEAARLYAMGCEGGSAQGCTNLGYLHHEGIGVEPDPKKAAQLFQMGCEGGDARGCTNLGYLHHEGTGVETNPEEAARLFQMGCDGGDALGCTSIGIFHEKGIGMAPDPKEAARLYQMGCESGDALGCTNLGYLHRNGIGMEPDLEEAARLYQLSCEGGNALGCTNLGYLHRNGIGMEQDPAEATRLYRLGCSLGSEDGCRVAEELEAVD